MANPNIHFEKTVRSSSDDYQMYWGTDVYLGERVNDLQKDQSNLVVHAFESINQIYSSGEVRGHRLLDIGTGPCLHSVIPAASWFDEITLSDFSTANIKTLQQWLDCEQSAYKFAPYFKYYSQLVGSGTNWQEMESNLRSKVKNVIKCDVHLSNPLHPIEDYQADVISSCLCLNSACSNIETYQKAMKNMVSLLRPGGSFILGGVYNSRYYEVGSEMFSSLLLNRSDVIESIALSGLRIAQYLDEVEIQQNDQKKIGFLLRAEKK